MTEVLDLDAARALREAARREAQETGPRIKLGGETFELAPEIPYSVVEAFKGMSSKETAGGALADIVPALLGEHYPKFLALDPPPTLGDVEALVNGLLEAYGVQDPLPQSP